MESQRTQTLRKGTMDHYWNYLQTWAVKSLEGLERAYPSKERAYPSKERNSYTKN